MSNLHKIDILNIEDPFNFWIAKKCPISFHKVISSKVQKDVEESGMAQAIVDDEDFIVKNKSYINTKQVFALYHDLDKKWYRARILEVNRTLSSGKFLVCQLIDLGQTITVSVNKVRALLDPKLNALPPLAHRCRLYGLMPTFPGTDL